MQPTMRKPGTTTISRKQGAGKQMILKKPQRGPGVAELERIRLQEEQEQRLLYHHQHQQDSAPYHLHFKQVPLFSSHHDHPPLFNPTFVNPNPNFINPLASSNAESPTIATPAAPTKPSLSPSLHTNPNLNPASVMNSSEFMPSHSSSEAPPPSACPSLSPSLAIELHSTYNEPSPFFVPYAISTQKSLFTNPSFSAPSRTANPDITPIHNTNPNLKINRNAQVWLNSASTLQSNSNASPSPSTIIEHSFLPLHTSPFEIANDITQPSLTYHATTEDGFFCTPEAPSYHDHVMYLVPSPNVENPSSLTDSSPNPPHEHNCKAPKKNIPAPQDAEELELPSFQSMFVKTQQQRMNPSYEKQYLRCNLDLNNTQGDYELAYNAKMNPRTKMISSRDNSTFGFETSTRDGFLKLGLPTIAEDWNHGGMQTRILERCNEHTMSPGMGVGYHALYGQMVKEKKPNIDLELKLSLPSFGYH